MAGLFSSVEDLVALLERPKHLIFPCSWAMPGKHGQRGLKLKVSLKDEIAALAGIALEIRCQDEGFHLPSSVVMMAEFQRKPRAMARIDINGSRHENRHAVCGNLQFVDAGATHFHDTMLHSNVPIEELFDGLWDLPVARPIYDMPEDFSGAMEKCGELLHIGNLREVEEPQWQPRRLPF